MVTSRPPTSELTTLYTNQPGKDQHNLTEDSSVLLDKQVQHQLVSVQYSYTI